MPSINEIITHYWEYKTKMDLVERKMKKLKKQMKDYVKDLPQKKYDNGDSVVSIVSSKRSGICRKDIPVAIWEEYAVTTPFEMICVRKKKSKTE